MLKALFVAVLGLCATLAAAPAKAQPAGVIYCCEAGGQTLCGDILPAACYGRAYREMNPSGTVRRQVPAPLTPAQAAQREAEERRLRAADQERLRQQRRDKALIDTYRSLRDLDERREREIAEIDRSLRALRERETELLLRHSQVLAARARVSGDAALRVEEDLRRIDGEIASQRGLIDARLRERTAVLDRFSEDRERYLQLSAPAGTGVAR